MVNEWKQEEKQFHRKLSFETKMVCEKGKTLEATEKTESLKLIKMK